MKKIAIFIDNLHVGGIQKSIVNILNNLDYSKYNIDLYMFSKDNFYEITTKPNIIILPHPPLFFKLLPFKLVKRIYKPKIKSEMYDVAIDFDSYQMHTALGALNCNAKKKVIWIHNDIFIKIKEEFKYRILYFFFKAKYAYFDTFCAVSKGALDSFKQIHNYSKKQYLVIPNYIDTTEILTKSKEQHNLDINKSKLNIVSVGRLCHQKGFDIMINNIKELTKYRTDFHLYIIGDGEERKKLTKQVDKLQLNEYITFLGQQKNPFKYVKDMDLFYLSSRYEGQGMVLLEAMSLGLDVVMPKHLEKYCPNVVGSDNCLKYLIDYVKKDHKQFNNLESYNKDITKSLNQLFSEK